MPPKDKERIQKKLIKELQKERGSRVFCYVTSDRGSFPPNIPGMNTQLATDIQPFVYEHLRQTGKTDKIDLFLYTRGGMTNSVLPLLNLFRSYCKTLSVLVPHIAHSGGTLICLGADDIIMGEMGELSPIDPTTANPFNPRVKPEDVNSPQVGISVEDVISFFELVKDEKVGIKGTSPNMLSAFQILSSKIHPLALGNVYRAYQQIRFIAKKLLEMHLKKMGEDKLYEIAEAFVKKFYSHDYSINYQEAKGILGGKIVKKATGNEEKLMHSLLEAYSDELELKKNFNLNAFMDDKQEKVDDEQEKELEVVGAYFESELLTHRFRTKSKVTQRQALPPNMHIQIQLGQKMPYIPGYPKVFNIEVVYQNWEKI